MLDLINFREAFTGFDQILQPIIHTFGRSLKLFEELYILS